jgi:tetratricopeptide (TPR) repeat protein
MDELDFEAALHAGVEHAQHRRFENALVCFHRALDIEPDNPYPKLNLGAAFADLGRYDEALPFATEAAAQIDTLMAHNNHGICLFRTGHFAQAEEAYRRALVHDCANARVQYNLAFVQLAQGQYEAGWKQIVWRKRLPPWAEREPFKNLPTWQGEVLTDQQTLVVFHEQGYGDTLMLSRFLHQVTLRAKNLVIVCPKALQHLLMDSFDVATTDDHHTITEADYQCSFFDLPAIFDSTIDNIPRIPYLTVDPVKRSRWLQRVRELQGRRVGLVWAGSKRPDPISRLSDSRRSMTLQQMQPLFDLPGVALVSLQKDDPADQITTITNPLVDWTDQLDDFSETAALISNLDLVVSVDTSVAHLAAGLGKPTWLLNRYDSCWRWLPHPHIWYRDTELREYRQAFAGDWATVIAKVRQALTFW